MKDSAQVRNFTRQEILHFSLLSEKPTKAPIDNSGRGESFLGGDFYFFLTITDFQWKYLTFIIEDTQKTSWAGNSPAVCTFPELFHAPAWREIPAAEFGDAAGIEVPESQCTSHFFAALSLFNLLSASLIFKFFYYYFIILSFYY